MYRYGNFDAEDILSVLMLNLLFSYFDYFIVNDLSQFVQSSESSFRTIRQKLSPMMFEV